MLKLILKIHLKYLNVVFSNFKINCAISSENTENIQSNEEIVNSQIENNENKISDKRKRSLSPPIKEGLPGNLSKSRIKIYVIQVQFKNCENYCFKFFLKITINNLF